MKNSCKNAPSLIKASIFSKNKQGLGFTLYLEDIELMCFRRLHRHQENLIKEKEEIYAGGSPKTGKLRRNCFLADLL